jgi:polyphosphate kinase
MGVQIDLIIRGACCLRPGVQGLSENIRVRSVLGRFLEHSRLFWFHAGGNDVLFASSADWMSRNLKRRVETCFPIEDKQLRDRLTQEDLFNYLGEDVQVWKMQSDGTYVRNDQGQDPPLSHPQARLLDKLCGSLHREDETGLPGEI